MMYGRRVIRCSFNMIMGHFLIEFFSLSANAHPPFTSTVAGLILGGYTILFTLVSLKPSSAKPEEVIPVKAAASSTAIPSVDDDSFSEFIENEANLQKWIDSAE